MGGRHSVDRGRKRRKGIWAFLLAFLLVVVGAGFTLRWISQTADDCAELIEISVDAAPSIAPALREFVDKELPKLEGDARCVRPVITAKESAKAVDEGNYASDNPNRPDVWIPESTVWLQRASQRSDYVPDEGVSIATTPVVLAASEWAAKAAGWPERNPTWSELLTGTAVTGAPDPSENTNAAFALLGIDALDLTTINRTAAIQKLTKHGFAGTGDPFLHLPSGGAEPTVAVFPSSEQAVLAHDASAKPGTDGSAVACYPEKPTPWLDYPAVAIRGPVEIKVNAAHAVQGALREPAAARTFAKHGFRTPAGKLTGHAATDTRARAESGQRVPPPTLQDANAVLQRWATFSAGSRMVVAVDVSGSMDKGVPGSGKTRMQVATATVAEALRLFRPNTQLTLWEFSTSRDGKRPYKRLVPWKPMLQHIADGLPDKLPSLLSKPAGQTGLYDTTLAAFQEAQRGWDPGMLNLVLVVTDGKNENPEGISRSTLLANLKKVVDPQKPVRLIYVGLGTEVDPKELRQIAKVTGGQVHLSPDVRKTRELFFTILRGLSWPPS